MTVRLTMVVPNIHYSDACSMKFIHCRMLKVTSWTWPSN